MDVLKAPNPLESRRVGAASSRPPGVFCPARRAPERRTLPAHFPRRKPPNTHPTPRFAAHRGACAPVGSDLSSDSDLDSDSVSYSDWIRIQAAVGRTPPHSAALRRKLPQRRPPPVRGIWGARFGRAGGLPSAGSKNRACLLPCSARCSRPFPEPPARARWRGGRLRARGRRPG